MIARNQTSMVVAGIMSGTSADGVDVALVRIAPGLEQPRVKLLGHRGFPYPKAVREALLRVMAGEPVGAPEIARLNWRLGAIYADCVEKTCAALPGAKLQLIGMHGQTIFHQGAAEPYLSKPVRATWQLGEAAVLGERLGVPVVSDFRSADLAAGGQAAPLVPMLDFCLFRSKTANRILLNLGGIANLTAIPAAGNLEDVLAFDTGPANMVSDVLMAQRFGKAFDRGGRVATRGKVSHALVAELLKLPYFASPPPKSCGREQFGSEFARRFAALSDADAVATAAEFTAASILDAYARFCWPHLGQRSPLARATELIAAGGGVENRFLMSRLAAGFQALGVKLRPMQEFGIPAQAKEAVAFALLAWLSFHGLPGNVPSATGAAGPVVLGKVTC